MIDRYTKVVLTIIAGALVALLAQHEPKIAQAQSVGGSAPTCGYVKEHPCYIFSDDAHPIVIRTAQPH